MPFHPTGPPQEERVRLPRPSEGEILGIVTQLHGAARMMVQCKDGKDRMCRVPGKIKRFIWVRTGDYVIIKPWSVEGDEKGDVVYRYTKFQMENLKRRGLITV